MLYPARAFAALFFVLMMLGARPAEAAYPAVSLNEIAQSADLIFAGTVASIDYKTSDSRPYTEATFAQVDVLNATARARQGGEDIITLRYAGGQMENGQFLDVSTAPHFEVGRRYMVFALDNGTNYLSPVVGGGQGMFEIVENPQTGREMLITAGGQAVTGLDTAGMPVTTTPPQVAGQRATRAPLVAAGGVPIGGDATISQAKRDAGASTPLNMNEFRGLVRDALTSPVRQRQLIINGDGNGKYVRLENGKEKFFDLKSTETLKLMERDIRQQLTPDSNDTSAPETSSIYERAQSLAVCGTHVLPLRMQQVPTDFWEYSHVKNSMEDFDLFLEVFEDYAADGGVGNNSQNEYGGAVSDAQLAPIYIPGWKWDGSLGVCFTYRQTAPCGRILQSDVFWNPSYTYASAPELWFSYANNYQNIIAVLIHETGHAWGYQTDTSNPELYDYNQPSVMHAVYKNVFETGRGIHAIDANILRAAYQSQRSPKSVIDFGIESYYADEGLKPSTISKLSVGWGDSINCNNVVVENMGNSTVSGIAVRFYLSKQMNFSGDEYQIGGSYAFTPFAAGSLSTVNFSNIAIPDTVPPGSYYLLAYVDQVVNGERRPDAFGDNNTAVFADKISVSKPVVAVSPSSLTQTAIEGQNAASQSFTVRNPALGKLNYGFSITYPAGPAWWVGLSPTSGSSTGEADTITVSYNTSTFSPGTYTATIEVGGQSSVDSRYIDVTVHVRPGNDNLTSAFSMSGFSGTVNGISTNGTKETGEPNHGGYAGGRSVWWTWTAPAAGTATIDTIGSNFDTLLGIYKGSNVSALQSVAQDDQSGGNNTSKVTFTTDYLGVYKVAVDGYGNAAGNVKLNWNLTAFPSGVADWSVY